MAKNILCREINLSVERGNISIKFFNGEIPFMKIFIEAHDLISETDILNTSYDDFIKAQQSWQDEQTQQAHGEHFLYRAINLPEVKFEFYYFVDETTEYDAYGNPIDEMPFIKIIFEKSKIDIWNVSYEDFIEAQQSYRHQLSVA